MSRPRLSIILKYEHQRLKFYTNNELHLDSDKQKEVASELKTVISRAGNNRAHGLISLFEKKEPIYRADNLRVFFMYLNLTPKPSQRACDNQTIEEA